ncbi:MAG: nucleoside-diphosphate kinase [Minisyncoccia bacterium]|jgi:nucleoside-diphosphate kinase
MKEETLVLIKPDAVKRGLYSPITQIYLYRGGLMAQRVKIFRFDKETARRFYEEHEGRLYRGEPYFDKLIEHAVSGETVSLVLSGENAVRRVRELNGATNPAEAAEGTIRRKFGDPIHIERNAVHGSDSVKSAEREIAIIFGKNGRVRP